MTDPLLAQGKLALSVVQHGMTGMKHIDRMLENKLGQTNAFIQRRDQMDIEWWGEVVCSINAAHAVLRELATYDQIQERRLSALEQRLSDDEALGVLYNYCRQAHEEATAERRRMLAFAAASLTNLDLRVSELARMQRVVRELDPSDILDLYRLWLCPSGVGANRLSPDEGAVRRYYYWLESGASVLETSGCVAVDLWLKEDTKRMGGRATLKEMHVTCTGRNMLAAMRPYILAREPDVTGVVGHAVLEDFRTKTEAQGILRQALPNFRELFAAARENVRYYCPNAVGGEHQTGAVFRLHVPPDAVGDLRSKVVPLNGRVPADPESVTVAYVGDTTGEALVLIVVCGPHDVLRHLAYDFHATWSPFHHAF
jgi:hypothetical protein